MNILIVSSSQRNDSKSFDVSTYIKRNILNKMDGVTSSILDLSQYPDLLDSYGVDRSGENSLLESKKNVLSQLYACDAIVFVVPEWGGMIPPALINLFLLSANGSADGLPLGHKPAFAVGVSGAGGGSYPISLLKGYTAKNSHIVWLPLHAVIQNVTKFLMHSWSPLEDNRSSVVQSRLEVGLKSLYLYASELKRIRHELVRLSLVHPYGQ